jgi:protein-S-isoprenylcysteine O-methyltransferase Ste14
VTGPSARWGHVPTEQLPWIMAGKWYLLVRLLYQVAIGVVWVSASWSGRATTTGRVSGAGLVCLVAGYGLRRWARHVLGDRFRSFEVRREPRGLETGGPYAYLRHPGYLGLALMDVGLPLLLNLPWLTLLSVAPLALLFRRSRLEDRLLEQAYR